VAVFPDDAWRQVTELWSKLGDGGLREAAYRGG